jgi:hypothetical protein
MATPPSPSGAFGGIGRPGMELWEDNTYVTASNPGWPGQNVYIAGGATSNVPVTGGLVMVNVVSGNISASFSVTSPSSSSFASVPWSSSSAVLLLQSNPSRVTFTVYNDASDYYLIALGMTASQTNFTVAIPPYFYYESPYPSWVGSVFGIGFSGGSGSGMVRITEQVP